MAAVLIINQLARALRGPRLGAALGAVLALLVGGALIFPTVVDTPEKTQRYTNILTPGQDGPFQERLYKWENAFADIDRVSVRARDRHRRPVGELCALPREAAVQVDSSYVQIAYEQGVVMMGLFVLTLIVLLLELIRHAIWTRDADAAALAMGAAGTLIAIVLALAGNLHINSLAMLGGWVIVGLGVATYAVRPRLPRTALRPEHCAPSR